MAQLLGVLTALPQDPHGSSQLSVIPVPGNPTPLQAYMQVKHIKKEKKKSRTQQKISKILTDYPPTPTPTYPHTTSLNLRIFISESIC